MKKLFLIAVLFCFAVVSQAQHPVLKAFVNDTTTNTELEYLVVSAPAPLQANNTLFVYVKPVNASGTATATATLQFSPDNTNWYDYGTSTTVNTAGAANAYSWILPDSPFKYLRVKLSSTGTGVTNFTGGYIIKAKQ